MPASFRLLPLLAALALTQHHSLAAPKPKATPAPKQTPQQTEEFTRLQIFLDNANFGPGKIDGHDGNFTRQALRLYRQTQGQPAPAEAPAPLDTSGLDLKSIDPVYLSYTITKEDAATVGTLPGSTDAQAKVKTLPYATLAEAIAEKFHCDLDFLKKLNPGKGDRFKVGAKVLVPNVKPFELGEVKSLQPGSEAANAAEDAAEPTQPAEPPPAGAPAPAAEPQISVHVSIAESLLQVMAGEKIVAAFPVTVGSAETVSPAGQWKVRAVAKMPNFRYDKKMLMKGERSSDFKILPPGPNNPVGIMWIALNKKGIGLHGTNDPDSIGRASSHGCIRLANWDVVKLAQLVKAGVPVTIE